MAARDLITVLEMAPKIVGGRIARGLGARDARAFVRALAGRGSLLAPIAREVRLDERHGELSATAAEISLWVVSDEPLGTESLVHREIFYNVLASLTEEDVRYPVREGIKEAFTLQAGLNGPEPALETFWLGGRPVETTWAGRAADRQGSHFVVGDSGEEEGACILYLPDGSLGWSRVRQLLDGPANGMALAGEGVLLEGWEFAREGPGFLFQAYDLAGARGRSAWIDNVSATAGPAANFFRLVGRLLFSGDCEEVDGRLLFGVEFWDTATGERGRATFTFPVETSGELAGMSLVTVSPDRHSVEAFFAVAGYEGTLMAVFDLTLSLSPGLEEVRAFRLPHVTYLATRGEGTHVLGRWGAANEGAQVVGLTTAFTDLIGRPTISRPNLPAGSLGELLPVGGDAPELAQEFERLPL